MEFGLSEEQKAIQETARRFAVEKLLPDYQKREKTGVIDRDLMREMGSLGLLGCDLPEEFGGLGTDFVTAGLVIEQIAYGDFNLSYLQLLASLLGGIVADFATPELKQEYVPKVIGGELILSLGLTEPRGGSDAAHLICKAEDKGDHFIVNGEKTSISFSEQSEMMILMARTNPDETGAHGVTGILVPLDLEGVSRTAFDDIGTKIVGRGQVFFDNVKVPKKFQLGEAGSGFTQIMTGFDYSRALIGLQCLGAAQASVDESWQYVQEREAFGQPIAKFQGVSFPLAEAETYLSAMRTLCQRTLWLRDNGLPHTSEAAMCKWWVPKTCTEIIHQCLLTAGHYGYTTDLPHQQRLRDVMGLQIGDGTAQIQKMIIAREKIGRVALQY